MARLEVAVVRDDLTGLLRRNPFLRKWEDLVAECDSRGEACGILMVDIDHFKRINDTFGHPVGDEVLCRVSELLRNLDGPECFSGRLGGEEFAVALRGTSEEVLRFAERIRDQVERLSEIAPGVRCTVSIGVARLGRSARPLEPAQLLEAADRALYMAKGRGRNRVEAA